MHTYDTVFWGVMIAFGGSVLVLLWLGFVLWRNMNDKSKNDGK